MSLGVLAVLIILAIALPIAFLIGIIVLIVKAISK